MFGPSACRGRRKQWTRKIYFRRRHCVVCLWIMLSAGPAGFDVLPRGAVRDPVSPRSCTLEVTLVALADYQKIVIQGKGPGSEIWQTGFATVVTTPITSQAGLQSYSNTLEPFVNTWWTSVKPHVAPLYSYLGIAVYQYQAPSTTAQFQAQTTRAAVPGTIVGSIIPIDTACVVSLRTAVPGRSTRGRMYVPCHDLVQATDGCWASSVNTAIGTATKTLFNAILGGSTGGVAVVSRTHNSYQLLTGLVTDNKPDVQRRRENRLAASNTQVLTFP